PPPAHHTTVAPWPYLPIRADSGRISSRTPRRSRARSRRALERFDKAHHCRKCSHQNVSVRIVKFAKTATDRGFVSITGAPARVIHHRHECHDHVTEAATAVGVAVAGTSTQALDSRTIAAAERTRSRA